MAALGPNRLVVASPAGRRVRLGWHRSFTVAAAVHLGADGRRDSRRGPLELDEAKGAGLCGRCVATNDGLGVAGDSDGDGDDGTLGRRHHSGRSDIEFR